ncbi:MAG: translation elongation factor Ts [Planctomycetota bacterium]
MAEINAKDVMALRNRTGLPMMACKKALGEAGGDPEKAEELLRKQLKGKMETKTDRAAGEGRIGIKTEGGSGAIVEIRAETDFTAKNDKFIDATEKVAAIAFGAGAGAVEPNDEISPIVDDIRISTGENISYARGLKVEAPTVGQYLHHDGKTGVLIEAEGDLSDEVLRQLGMHITAAVPVPLGVSSDDVPADAVEKERKFRVDQAMESGKPQEIAEKMVEGGMRKYFSEVALLEQDFVMDPSKKIKDIIGGATIKAFHRWAVGETS